MIKINLKFVTKIIIVFIFYFIVSCSKNKIHQSIYGKWESIGVDSGQVVLEIDSINNTIIYGYPLGGGGKFRANYTITNNEIRSKILPDGIKVMFDEDGYMKIYPLNTSKKLQESIELIYSVKFKRRL